MEKLKLKIEFSSPRLRLPTRFFFSSSLAVSRTAAPACKIKRPGCFLLLFVGFVLENSTISLWPMWSLKSACDRESRRGIQRSTEKKEAVRFRSRL
jgi:hypothetical protein